MRLIERLSLAEVTGQPRDYLAASDLAYSVFENGYDPDLLSRIASAAQELADQATCEYLALRHVRGVHTRIPEVEALMTDRRRLAFLSDLAGTALEPYPITTAASHINFYDAGATAIDFHTDGAAFVELIPIEISGRQAGGHTVIYTGPAEVGKERLAAGDGISENAVRTVAHALGRSVLLQGRRLLHAAEPLRDGRRVTLVLVLRSVEEPWKDDNSLMRLMLDDPYEAVVEEWLDDVRERKFPAYRAAKALHF